MGRFKLGRKIKNLSKKTGRKIKEVSNTIGSDFKETATEVVEKAQDVGGTSKRVARRTGRKIKNSGKTVGANIKESATVVKKKVQRVGRATGRLEDTTSRKIKNGAKTTGRVLRRNVKKVMKISDFKLNIHFKICHSRSAFSDADVKIWIEERITLAEKLFAMKPRLKLSYTFERVKNGADLLTKRFIKGVNYTRFMNTSFDNEAKTVSTGSLVFLVVNQWEVSKKRFKKGDITGLCGKAFFPFYPGWRKHAIILQKSCSSEVFSHELGHVFGLHHTFEKGGICTKKYPKRKGGTAKGNRSNLMDYNREAKVFLNDCQERTAALFRRRYMTITGKVNYLKLKGII